MKLMYNPPEASRSSTLSLHVGLLATLLFASLLKAEQAAPGATKPQDADAIVLPEFQVSTSNDKGYRASNSVSGTRFDTPIKDLPFALQAFTEDFISDIKPVNIFDVVRYSPGVTFSSPDFVSGNTQVSIRGYATGLLRNGLGGPSVLDFANVARVEVMKGPASFLYGQLSPGGIVNVITKKPKEKAASTIQATYGTYDYYRVQADTTGPVGGTGVFYRVAGAYEHDISFWNPYKEHATDFSPSLVWKATDKLKFSLDYERLAKRESPEIMQKPGLPHGIDYPGLPDTFNIASYKDYRNSDMTNLVADMNLQVGEHWNTRAVYSHSRQTVDFLLSGNLALGAGTSIVGRRFRDWIATNKGDTYGLEAVGAYKFGGVEIKPLLGTEWKKQHSDTYIGQLPASLLQPNWDLSNPSTWNRDWPASAGLLFTTPAYTGTLQGTGFNSKAYYAGVTLGFFDSRLLALIGARRTSSDSQLLDKLTNITQPKFETARTTPQVGLLYKLTKSVSAFASYSESFVPNATMLAVLDVPTYVAKPTIGKGTDIGFKADAWNGRLSSTITYFDVKNTNIIQDIVTQLTPTDIRHTQVQSGEQRSQGVEMDATLSPTDHWQIYGSYSYMNARVTSYPQTPALVGTRLQMSARAIGSVWTRYNFSSDSLKGFFVGGGFNRVYHQTILGLDPLTGVQTYTLWDATAGYDFKWKGHNSSVSLNGKNLGNIEYRPSQNARSRPREVILTLSTQF